MLATANAFDDLVECEICCIEQDGIRSGNHRSHVALGVALVTCLLAFENVLQGNVGAAG